MKQAENSDVIGAIFARCLESFRSNVERVGDNENTENEETSLDKIHPPIIPKTAGEERYKLCREQIISKCETDPETKKLVDYMKWFHNFHKKMKSSNTAVDKNQPH
eukprot:TRINITY_DN13669_c0_g2_i8.p2 TRINITY_DN13669_c0_g2~~TRINITY_DN13669_c0_g2_i8.p2  ORF type:complete len:106 (-),score=5.26 TRINITY_DN13669_c0_g2_i8:78-395(-)